MRVLDVDKLQPLLDTIYEASLDRTHWQTFMVQLLDVLKARSGSLIVHQPVDQPGVADVLGAHGIDVAALADYNEVYAPLDIYKEPLKQNPIGSVLLSHEFMPEEELIKTKFYREFLKPKMQTHYMASLTVSRESGFGTVLGIARDDTGTPFDNETRLLLETIHPHMLRALRISRKLGEAQYGKEIHQSALNQLSAGIVLLDRQGRVQSLNHAAEDMFARNLGLIIAKGFLVAHEQEEGELLDQCVNQACSDKDRQSGAMVIRSKTGAPALQVLVTPADLVNSDFVLGDPNAIVMVIITEVKEKNATDVDLLKAQYGFTNAEMRVIVEMMGGLRPAEIAEKLHLTQNTLKTHCKSIYRRAGVNSQAALMKLILCNPVSLLA